MAFVRSVLVCLWKSVDFRGRASRAEFWSYSVFWTLSCAVASYRLGAYASPTGASLSQYSAMLGEHVLVVLVPVVLLVPFAAVAVRRLHDINVSGWWLISASVPVPVVDLFIVGAQVICFARPGTAGANRYGPDPTARATARASSRSARTVQPSPRRSPSRAKSA